MKNYQITIGYKAIITVDVKADDEEQAKEIALKKFSNQRDKIQNNSIHLQDDNFTAHGVLDMDETWNMI